MLEAAVLFIVSYFVLKFCTIYYHSKIILKYILNK